MLKKILHSFTQGYILTEKNIRAGCKSEHLQGKTTHISSSNTVLFKKSHQDYKHQTRNTHKKTTTTKISLSYLPFRSLLLLPPFICLLFVCLCFLIRVLFSCVMLLVCVCVRKCVCSSFFSPLSYLYLILSECLYRSFALSPLLQILYLFLLFLQLPFFLSFLFNLRPS